MLPDADMIDKTQLLGMSLFTVSQKLSRQGYSIGEIHFRESRIKRLTVIDVAVRPDLQKVDLVLAGGNPIQHLPSLYQKNEFLRKFLWIFQHISYDITGTLDNIHSYFTPVDAPIEFVKWLASWFNMRVDFSDNEDRMRSLLQFAVPLYRWRGTVIGLKKLLLLLTGTEPLILENEIPYEAFTVLGETKVSATIIDTSKTKSYFTVHFPVSSVGFDAGLIQKITRIISLEKPAHTQFFLTFAEKDIGERKKMVISDTLEIGLNDDSVV